LGFFEVGKGESRVKARDSGQHWVVNTWNLF
jgi:hypothetical protein